MLNIALVCKYVAHMGHWPSGLSNIKLTKLTYYENRNTIYWNWFIYKTVEFLNLKMYTSRHKYAAFLSRDFMLLKPFYSLFYSLVSRRPQRINILWKISHRTEALPLQWFSVLEANCHRTVFIRYFKTYYVTDMFLTVLFPCSISFSNSFGEFCRWHKPNVWAFISTVGKTSGT